MFNYYALLKGLTAIAEESPNIHQVLLSDVYALNTIKDAKFSVFAITPGKVTEDHINGYRRYQLYLYYIDRLDSSGECEMIQSTGIEELARIIGRAQEDYPVEATSVVYNLFTMSFAQETAGVYAEVLFEVPYEACVEDID